MKVHTNLFKGFRVIRIGYNPIVSYDRQTDAKTNHLAQVPHCRWLQRRTIYLLEVNLFDARKAFVQLFWQCPRGSAKVQLWQRKGTDAGTLKVSAIFPTMISLLLLLSSLLFTLNETMNSFFKGNLHFGVCWLWMILSPNCLLFSLSFLQNFGIFPNCNFPVRNFMFDSSKEELIS